ncbi:uncharacterized protein RAG0_12614 [Rhynchosporium agropyri]|uniref:Uncharacterized protein n=1 Tax=Rhynchosporium agropyri TaxID=914238 RepID=A0A1E1L9I2_9HELO|nr:uncharacterized protein RAG0_12614 [Rhynchosporium agropyri]
MGIAYDSSDLARNEVLIGILSKFSPTDIIKSAELKTSFRGFFRRGTVDDSLRLLQWVSQADRSDKHRHTSLSDTISSKLSLGLLDGVPSPHNTSPCGTSGDTSTSIAAVLSPVSGPQICIHPTSPSANAPLTYPCNPVVNYFTARGVRADRINRLNRYIDCFVNAEVLPLEAYANLWSDKGKIFAGSENGMRRLCRLQRGRLQIEERMSQYGTAARLCLMFSVVDVDHYASTATPAELGLRAHRCRRTAALEKIAKVNNISKEDLHQDKRKSRNYFELLFGPGPGSLLLTGSETAFWEVNTNKGDVRLALEYVQIHLPELHHTLISLNGVGARTIVQGLLAYGWTVEEIKSSPIPFMKEVRKHLDENLTIPMTERLVPASQHTYTTNQSSKKRVSDEVCTGKTEEDHAHKFHTSNQSSFACNDRIAETSPLGDFGIEHHCSGIASTTSLAGDIPDDVTRRIDSGMASTSRSCVDSFESWRQVVSTDPRMTSSLCTVDCLPISLEQDPSRKSVSTIDPNMTCTLGAGGGLPSSLETSPIWERPLTINPSLLTIDPSMTSSLGAVDYLPLWSEIQVERGSSQYPQT